MHEGTQSNSKQNKGFSVPPKPEGRYNEWGQRKWLQASSRQIDRVDRQLRDLGLAERAHSLLRAALLCESRGIEFVVISNAQFPDVVRLEGDILIVPCFSPDLPQLGPHGDERAYAMMKRGFFVYDGWAPIRERERAAIDNVVATLDDTVHLVSLPGRFWAHWEPKYWGTSRGGVSFEIGPAELDALQKTIDTLGRLPSHDRRAILKSIAWLANAMRVQWPVLRFLLLFLSIESLVTYIEGGTDADSPLRSLAKVRLTKSERQQARDACIARVLEHELEADPTRAVKAAYFDCVIGTKRMLEEHLARVFPGQGVDAMITREKVEGKTLWDLRCDIAHGNMDILSERQVEFLTERTQRLNVIARTYLQEIVSHLARAHFFPLETQLALTFLPSQAIGTPGVQYMGPTDMAEYYASIEVLSTDYLQAGLP